MATTTTLPIAGYRGEAVPNRLLQPREPANALAILLPGLAYTLDMPLFYYAEHLLLERGWDVLRVEYAYNLRPEYAALPQPEQRRWLRDDTTAAYRSGLGRHGYDRVALVGKSLGTLAMGHLLTLAESPAAPARAVWLTPLLKNPELRRQIAQFGGPSLFVIGGADPHYNPVILQEMSAATNGEAVVVDGADHGMDIPGDPVGSVRGLERIVVALSQFLDY
jgi:predicted alpha/beta-hydrolase family hydrolase